MLLCPRYSFPGPLLWGGAVTEVLHDLRSGLALSSVRHDLPCKKKNNWDGVPKGSACFNPSKGGAVSLDRLIDSLCIPYIVIQHIGDVVATVPIIATHAELPLPD